MLNVSISQRSVAVFKTRRFLQHEALRYAHKIAKKRPNRRTRKRQAERRRAATDNSDNNELRSDVGVGSPTEVREPSSQGVSDTDAASVAVGSTSPDTLSLHNSGGIGTREGRDSTILGSSSISDCTTSSTFTDNGLNGSRLSTGTGSQLTTEESSPKSESGIDYVNSKPTSWAPESSDDGAKDVRTTPSSLVDHILQPGSGDQAYFDEQHTVGGLVVGDGLVGMSGAQGMRNIPYACSKSSELLDWSAFWTTIWSADIFTGMSDDTFIFKTYKPRGAQGWVPGMGSGSFTIPKRSQTDKPRKQEIADKLLEFLRACQGTVVRLSGMGARSNVSWPQGCLRSVPRQPLCRAHELDCARAAAVNAVFACSGEQSAYAIASVLKQDHRVLYCFKKLGEIFHRANGKRTRCTIVKPQALQREIQKRERQAAFKALATKKVAFSW